MSHLQNYQVVQASTLEDLHLKISGLIGEGWELHGSPKIMAYAIASVTNKERPLPRQEHYYEWHFFQAMVLLKAEVSP